MKNMGGHSGRLTPQNTAISFDVCAWTPAAIPSGLTQFGLTANSLIHALTFLPKVRVPPIADISSLFVQARGVLKKDLQAHLRSGRAIRRSRHAA